MSIFRASFPAFVQRQLNARQDLLTRSARDSKFLQYTTGKNAWVRMTSFVNYDSSDGKLKGDALSRQYILESGTLFPMPGAVPVGQTGKYALRSGVGNIGGSYTNRTFSGIDTQMGLRPMPGIISVDIKSRGAYGSLREATIKFMAYTKQQVEDLEILFMRVGYGVLVEWGWSMYLDTFKNNFGSANTPSANRLSIDAIQIRNFTDPTINPFSQNLDPFTLYAQVEKLQEKFSGNYDGMYGLIKNFNITLLENGSYECTTVLISVGDVLDSLKINSTSLPVSIDNSSQNKNNALMTKFESLFNPILTFNQIYFINNVIGQDLYQKYRLDKSTLYSPDNVDFIIHSIDFQKGPSNLGFKGKDGSLHYISFAAFIAAMNANFLLYDPRNGDSIPIMDIELPFPGYGKYGDGLCLASEDTVSIDPTVCMIKNTFAKFVADPKKGFDMPNAATFYPFHYKQTKNLGIIGNIYVCVENLINTFRIMSANSNGYLSLHDYVRTILRQCSDALGSINDFGIFVHNSSAAIMDTHYLDPEPLRNNKFVLNIMGTDSAVRNFNITSKIFESQSTLIAIGAGVRENISAIQSSTYNLLNRGLTDRIIVQKLEHDALPFDNGNPTSSDTDYKNQLASMVINLRQYINAYINDKDLSQIEGNKQAAISNLNSILLKINTDTNYKAVLPISVELTIDGIGGIVIGNVFRINNDALPREYVSKNLGLIVTGLATKLENSDWITVISTQCCILEPEIVKSKFDGSSISNSLNKFDKQTIEDAINEQAAVAKANNENNLQSQIYIYNNLIKLIIAIFAPNNKDAVLLINAFLDDSLFFGPGGGKVAPFIFEYSSDFIYSSSPSFNLTIKNVNYPGYPINNISLLKPTMDRNDFNRTANKKTTENKKNGNILIVSNTGTQYILNPFLSDKKNANNAINTLVQLSPDYDSITDSIISKTIIRVLVDIQDALEHDSNASQQIGKGFVNLPILYLNNGNVTIYRNIMLDTNFKAVTDF